MFAGQIPPDVNESHYLPKAKHFWDPTWCAGDLFLGSSFSHWLFYVTTGWLTRFLSLADASPSRCGRDQHVRALGSVAQLAQAVVRRETLDEDRGRLFYRPPVRTPPEQGRARRHAIRVRSKPSESKDSVARREIAALADALHGAREFEAGHEGAAVRFETFVCGGIEAEHGKNVRVVEADRSDGDFDLTGEEDRDACVRSRRRHNETRRRRENDDAAVQTRRREDDAATPRLRRRDSKRDAAATTRRRVRFPRSAGASPAVGGGAATLETSSAPIEPRARDCQTRRLLNAVDEARSSPHRRRSGPHLCVGAFIVAACRSRAVDRRRDGAPKFASVAVVMRQ